MTNRMNAVSTYRPKINLGQLVQTPELRRNFVLIDEYCENEKSREWDLSPAQDGDDRAEQTDNGQS